mgnify:CR=1 FL=1|tara:strand:- start:539 stop:1408 length:870 start_codon:yes stop_codon:yes gene_type:complete
MYHARKKKKEYRGGGMVPDMLMKMMQGGMLKTQEMPGGGMMPKYPGGGMMPRKRGMMYAEEGNIIERRRRDKALEAGRQRVPEGLDRGGVYFDPEAGSFYRVGASADGLVGVPMTGMTSGDAGKLLNLIAEQADQRGGRQIGKNVFGFVTKGDTDQVRGADDPLLQLISEGGDQPLRQNPYGYASMVAENPDVRDRRGVTSQGFKSSIKRILGEAMRANDVEKVNQIMGTIMNPEFADLIPGLSPMAYEGTGFMPYNITSGDRRFSTVENLRVEPQDEDQRRSPGSLPR